MRQLLSLLVLGLTLISADTHSAEAKQFKMYSSKTKKYLSITVMDYQGFTISQSCLKEGKMRCDAWKAAQKKVEPVATPGVGVIGNPAARYCQAQKSLNRILLDSKEREFDYCEFGDGSVIDAWSLYNKHFSSKQ